jgi:hypothetical protein
MSLSLPPLLAWALARTWTVALLGGVAALLAFLLVRRLLVPTRPAAGPESDLAENFLAGILTDRRATPRRPGNAVGVDLQDESGHALEGWVLNRSLGGLCLVVDRAVAEGTALKVRPHRAPASIPWTAIQVKDCRPDCGLWELNCQFVQTPNCNTLLLFG